MSAQFNDVLHNGVSETNNYPKRSWPKDVGIISIEFYIPNCFVDQSELETFDDPSGKFQGKYTVGLGQKQMGFVGDNEDVNSLCLTVVSRLFTRQGYSPGDFGRVEVGTESILDRSKGVKTVLMQLFGDDASDVEGVDNVNACYGGTAALFNTVHWVESSGWDGRLGLVVAADIAIYAQGNARCTGGAGAVAMVVGPNAALVLDSGLRGTHMKHVYDFYKPQLDSEYPKVDGPLSVKCYQSALDICFARYREKYNRQVALNTPTKSGDLADKQKPQQLRLKDFDAIMFHTPYSKIVQKSLGRLVLSEYLHQKSKGEVDPQFGSLSQFSGLSLENSHEVRNLEKELIEISRPLFESHTLSSLRVAKRVGNMYTPSLYGCLLSFLTSKEDDQLRGNRLAMFSYGSGMAATMYSITISSDVSRISKLVTPLRTVDSVLDARVKFAPAQFVEVLKQREDKHNCCDYVPCFATELMQPETYFLKQVDKEFRRHYQTNKIVN